MLDHLLGADVERAADHRHLDQPALAGAAPALQRDEQPDEGVQAGARVARTEQCAGRMLRRTADPGHPGDLLHRHREPGAVAPRTAEAERRHAHHQRVGAHGAHVVPRQPEAVHHPRAVVLHDDVALGDQPARPERGPRRWPGRG